MLLWCKFLVVVVYSFVVVHCRILTLFVSLARSNVDAKKRLTTTVPPRSNIHTSTHIDIPLQNPFYNSSMEQLTIDTSRNTQINPPPFQCSTTILQWVSNIKSAIHSRHSHHYSNFTISTTTLPLDPPDSSPES